jgi:Fungal Zn(2)-Cys(6) binuclear cluster domain
MTCRKRKLKCDEARPICANCQKGSRQCVPAEPLTFRNQQNPSLNDGTEDSNAGLKSFYKYRDTFDPDRIWAPIPKVLRFVNITNPYGHDPEEETVGEAGNTGYQQMATHTLEALSTAATRDSTSDIQFASYPSTTYAENNTMFAHYNVTRTEYPPYAARPDISNALNSSVIDPNLEAVSTAAEQTTATTLPELTLPFQFK